TWLFSATISPEIRKIADQYMYYPEEVRIQPQARSAESIQQYYYIVPEEEKHRALRKLLKSADNPYGIIFCQTKRDVVMLTRKLRDHFPLDCLHGAMQQSDRDQVMDEFRQGKLRLLVSTDIMARGIDVDNLTHVINYSPPADPESYIHRIGRTARKGETGTAITFFTPSEAYALESLQRKVKMTLTLHPDSTGVFEPISRPPRRSRPIRAAGGPPGAKKPAKKHYGPRSKVPKDQPKQTTSGNPTFS
ncbi:MAG TPA: DEAD/DEAH box helicase, partial [Oculatellaceae cyanobacterium]